MTPKIRVAVRADLTQIYELLREGHDREMPMIPIDRLKALKFIARVLETGVILVAVVNGKIVGSIGVIPDQWWFSDRWFLREYWTYVSPAHRRSRIAVKLIKQIKKFADKARMPLMIGVFSYNQAKRKNKLYRKHFKPMGEFFLHGLDKEGI